MRCAGILLVMLPLLIAAQDIGKIKPGWKAITAAGFIAGNSGPGAIFHFSAGVTLNRYFAGLGSGFNIYEYNSFPLFADLRVGMGRRQLVFVYAMPGYNIPGKFEKEVNVNWRSVTEKLNGGFYLDAGIGYRIPLGSENRLSFSTGYIHKSVAHRKVYTYLCGSEPCASTNTEKFVTRYSYGLLNTKLSWEFGK